MLLEREEKWMVSTRGKLLYLDGGFGGEFLSPCLPNPPFTSNFPPINDYKLQIQIAYSLLINYWCGHRENLPLHNRTPKNLTQKRTQNTPSIN